MFKVMKILIPSLFAGMLFSTSVQAQSCFCIPTFVKPPLLWLCNIGPGPTPTLCPDTFISVSELDHFIGPITPEQVGDAFNIRFIANSLGVCGEYKIMTFPVDEWDSNGPDTRLWNGFNHSGSMVNDDGGFQYNFAHNLVLPCTGDNVDMSIDFYPNDNNKKAFYLYIVKQSTYEGSQKPATW